MRIDQPYYYGENLRWDFWWHSPNEAALFLAYLIVILAICLAELFTLRHKLWAKALAFLLAFCEIALWFALCKTYSRGGIVTAVVVVAVSLIVFFLYYKSKPTKIIRPLAWQLLPRFGILLLFLIITGFIGRISPSYVGTDGSVGNRWILWKEGLRMTVIEPFGGWAEMRPVEVFSNWFQPVTHSESYLNFVNGWLDIGLEFGVHWVALGIFLLSYIAFCALRLNKKSAFLLIVSVNCMGITGVFLLGNVFSSFVHLPSLWIPAMISFMVLAIATSIGAKPIFHRGALTFATCITLFSLAAWWICGSILLSNDELVVKKDESVLGVKIFKRSKVLPESSGFLVMSDPRIVGWDYGKAVRQLTLAHDTRFTFYAPPIIWEADALNSWISERNPDFILLMGSQYQKISRDSLNQNLILVHPIGLEFPAPDKVRQIILPGVYQDPTFYRWEEWAIENNIPVTFSSECGVDIRYAWETIIKELI